MTLQKNYQVCYLIREVEIASTIELVFRDTSNLKKRENVWRRSYPQWFVYALLNLEDEIILRGVEFVTPKIWFPSYRN